MKTKRSFFHLKIIMPLICFAGLVFLSLFSAGCMLSVDPSEPHRPEPQQSETTEPPVLPPPVVTYNRIGIDSSDFVNIRDFLEQRDAEGVKNGEKLAERCGKKYFTGVFSDFGGCFIADKNGRLSEVHLMDAGLVGKIDLTRCETLRAFECSNTNITDIDLSGITKLETVRIENSPVSVIDISGCTEINDFVCRNTRISEIEIKSNSADLICDITDNYCTDISLSVLSDVSYNYIADISMTGEGSGSVGLQYGQKKNDPKIKYDFTYYAYPAEGYEIDAWIDADGNECSRGTRTLGSLSESSTGLTAVFRKIRRGAPADELEKDILNGKTFALNGGETLPADWQGMDVDLDADGFKDSLRLSFHNKGSYADDPLYVLSLNGERLYSWRESEKTRFFLASIDGSSIQLFIDTVLKQDDETPPDGDGNTEPPDDGENPPPDAEIPPDDDDDENPPLPPDDDSDTPPAEREEHFLSVHSCGIITDATTQRVLSDKIRLTAYCSMEEFVFCESITEYLRMGYNCFVCAGDSADLDGDGRDENISIEYRYDINNFPVETVITAKNTAGSASLHLPAENTEHILTYNNIAYKPDGSGGLFITGKLIKENKTDGSKTAYIFRAGFKNGAFGKIEYI